MDHWCRFHNNDTNRMTRRTQSQALDVTCHHLVIHHRIQWGVHQVLEPRVILCIMSPTTHSHPESRTAGLHFVHHRHSCTPNFHERNSSDTCVFLV
ncbi:hypothetical protein MPTK2_8g13080 [Marchantia polymorpha subsp. ruderalis]